MSHIFLTKLKIVTYIKNDYDRLWSKIFSEQLQTTGTSIFAGYFQSALFQSWTCDTLLFCLSKNIQENLNKLFHLSIRNIQKKLLVGLQTINDSSFYGMQKAWILQHLLLSRLRWPLLVYDVCATLAAKSEQKIFFYLCKWFK